MYYTVGFIIELLGTLSRKYLSFCTDSFPWLLFLIAEELTLKTGVNLIFKNLMKPFVLAINIL